MGRTIRGAAAGFQPSHQGQIPDIRMVSSVGPFAEGEQFEYLSKEMAAHKADIVDEHYYRNPEWFLQNANRYDKYPRTGPRIFAVNTRRKVSLQSAPTIKTTGVAPLRKPRL